MRHGNRTVRRQRNLVVRLLVIAFVVITVRIIAIVAVLVARISVILEASWAHGQRRTVTNLASGAIRSSLLWIFRLAIQHGLDKFFLHINIVMLPFECDTRIRCGRSGAIQYHYCAFQRQYLRLWLVDYAWLWCFICKLRNERLIYL